MSQVSAPDEDKLRAIQEMKLPETLADVSRFLGMVTYLGKFIPQISKATERLRKLAQRQPFTVNCDLRAAFQSAQETVANALEYLAYF